MILGHECASQAAVCHARIRIDLQDPPEKSLGLRVTLLAAANRAQQGQGLFLIRIRGEHGPERSFRTPKVSMCELGTRLGQ